MPAEPIHEENKILVWDAPTRIFHWLLVLAFAAAWSTGESDRLRDLHVFAGYLMLGLLGFRLAWGLVGSRYARFRAFCFSPKQALEYAAAVLRKDAPRYIGHNPAGSWAIYLLLALGFLVCLSGILDLGAEEGHGVFAGIADYAGGEALKALHAVLAWLMLGLVLVHLAGVGVENRLHRENLVWAMLTGRKQGQAADAIASAHYGIGIFLLLLAVAGGLWFFQERLLQTPARPYLPFLGKSLPDNKLWREECGTCHVAYHPTLLPARSWVALMQKQDDHFGESLGLDAATTKGILAFLERYSADTEMTEPAVRIKRSVAPGAAPLRITETGYWVEKHEDIPEEVWRNPKVGSKANCSACHLDAERGTYEDAAMRLPEGISPIPQRGK